MPRLNVLLDEGFSEDTVVVRMDGHEVHRAPAVTTRLLTGSAGSFSLDVPAGPATLQVEVPGRTLVEEVPLELNADAYLIVRIRDGGIEHHLSHKPIGYM